MVFVAHYDAYPAHYKESWYRIEANPAGGYDVYLDPPANPIGAPLVEPAPEQDN
jgi:hypothetical protein